MLADGVEKVLASEAQFPGLDHEAFNFVAEEGAELLLRGRRSVRDHRADAGLDCEETLLGEGRDDFLGRVGVDAQFLAEDADGGKIIAGFESAADGRLLHGVHDLLVGV